MPFVAVTHTAAADPERDRGLARGFTELMAEVLGKKAALTSVLVSRAEAAVWTVGGSQPGLAAHVEACITRGTNDEAQKAAFIKASMALLSARLGTLPEATYVVLREIEATDWGYGGRTQASRRP
ncbi:MAG: tautomerase family protein [Actinomycetota bacterium]